MIKKILLLLFFVQVITAQEKFDINDTLSSEVKVVENAQLGTSPSAQPEMADQMRADGKIYVVIAVIAIVFACLAALMIYMDRKIKKLEGKLESKN